MELYKELDLNIKKTETISFVGGGGKTTSIKVLARELANLGFKVLITTSTMIFEPIQIENFSFFLKDIPNNFKPGKGTITILGDRIRDGKLIGCSLDKINEINARDLFDYILIEADGAKRKPIKAPESHEPVICTCTTITIGVLGIDAIGLEINEQNVHRPARLKEILSVSENHIIDYKDVATLSLHPNGMFKNSKGKKILLINKIRENSHIKIGKQIRDELKDSEMKIVLGDVINKMYY